MLNLIGSEFDVANLVHAVLADCEHRRRAVPEDLAKAMEANARRKLATARLAFDEAGGDPAYWTTVEDEVLHTALPQYVEIAERQNRLERASYDVWRHGDLLARATFTLIGLTVGGIIVKVPFIPIFIDAFAFFLAICGWFYPDLKKLFYDFRYTRRLNAILAEAIQFQRRSSMQFVTMQSLNRMIGKL
ncbi:MAG TPA: hypothetical protein VER58_11630 [Thermoanaerobaculia bacterium]|nr:hypothetical protein [Thermoanaerobaculia bacterium]